MKGTRGIYIPYNRTITSNPPPHFHQKSDMAFLQKLCLQIGTWQIIGVLAVYRSRYGKPPLAATCCHVANDLTNFTGNKQLTDKRTNRQTEGHRHRVKPPPWAPAGMGKRGHLPSMGNVQGRLDSFQLQHFGLHNCHKTRLLAQKSKYT